MIDLGKAIAEAPSKKYVIFVCDIMRACERLTEKGSNLGASGESRQTSHDGETQRIR
jgi:hypothetical protein